MKKIVTCFLLLLISQLKAQEPLLTLGSSFPDMVITNISNAPVKEFYLNSAGDRKFYILNFWGTWCSPCIPEMDVLAKLQKDNAEKIQVIAISDDNEERKAAYLKNKPSDLWLATDTNYTLYKMLNFSFVGQSAIVSPDKKIVALVRTDSINQSLIDKILLGDRVSMSAGFKEAVVSKGEDPFGVDTLLSHSFTISGYKQGQSGGVNYKRGVYADRRVISYNRPIAGLYRMAYGIHSYKAQEFYDEGISEKDVSDFEDKNTLYCVDLLVRPEQKDSLYILLRKYLQEHLPIKARSEKRVMPVYELRRSPQVALAITASVSEQQSMMFSGRGYDGMKVSVKEFAEEYLTNELGLPVVDETGLNGYYDIKTNVEQRNREGIIKSIEALGFIIEKTAREMPVIVYYRE